MFQCQPKGTIEKNILREIKRNGLTVREVSRRTGISDKKMYSAFEGRSELRLGYFLKICQLLRLDPREMAGRPSERKEG